MDTSPKSWKPTKQQLAEAVHKRVPDILAPDLNVLFVGVNPGLYTAAIGHHFGRPGNRFWPALHGAGFTPRLWSPFEDDRMPSIGCGLTNFVARPTARAEELSAEELREGARILTEKVRRYRPRFVAFVGLSAYRTALDRPDARVGRAEEPIAGVAGWVLPNTSGLNAHYLLPDLIPLFGQLREAAGLASAGERRGGRPK